MGELGLFIERLFCCPVEDCDREYKSKFNLKKHIQTWHLNAISFNCKVCNKKFVSKQNLREHNFIHLNKKPFKCTFCGKKFRQSSQLCLHKRSHKKNYGETCKFLQSINEL